MAEARSVALLGSEFRSGVALSVDDEGLHFRTSVTIPPWNVFARRVSHRARRFYRTLQYRAWPFASPLGVVILTLVVVGLVLNSPSDSWIRSGPLASFVWRIGNFFPWLPVPPALRIAILAMWSTIVGVIILAWAERVLLKLLLTSKAYLYQTRGKPSIWIKLWFFLVSRLTRGNKHTYTFQSSLPRMPVPDVKETVRKYLESSKNTQSPEEFEKTKELAASFLKNEGPKLNFYLKLKSWFSPNYVTDWWEDYVYLAGRSSLCVNSNYYILDSGRSYVTRVREARAAGLLWRIMNYKSMLEDETIEPVMAANGAVPLDMWQFERMFCSSRVPGREKDDIKHWESTFIRHVAVTSNGVIYKLNVFRPDGSLRSAPELQQLITEIARDSEKRSANLSLEERSIPALTAENRTNWAVFRETYFSEGVNRRSLETIESSILFLALDNEEYPLEDWQGRGKALLASNPSTPNVWFDKSINLVCFNGGKAGLNCEHTWADAPVAAHLLEVSLIVAENEGDMYDENGNVRDLDHTVTDGKPITCGSRGSSKESAWVPLEWSLSSSASKDILKARQNLQDLADNLNLSITAYTKYGKDFVKKCRVSPDAYIQMAMQLAYHRDQGRFDATYESSMTRLFLHGRTETVRPCTAASCNFVRLMEDKSASAAAKLKALQDGAVAHVAGYTDAMAGNGIDRHLFALYCVSVGKKVDSPFLKSALSVPWKLSTSQQPQQQTTLWDIKDPKWMKKISPGGGFGPVCETGYGISYMVSGEYEIYFHVSSLHKVGGEKNVVESNRMRDRIFEALDEMQQILSLALDEEKKQKEAKAAASAAIGDKKKN